MATKDQKKFDECYDQAVELMFPTPPEGDFDSHEEYLSAMEVRKNLIKANELHIEDKAHWLWTRWKGASSLFYFGSKIIGLEKAIDAKSRRKRMDPKLHKRMADELQREEDTLQLYPRLHMKSTWVKYWCIWQIVRNPNIRIGLWSRTTKLVRKELRSIKGMCRKPILKDLWPEVFVEKWEKDTQDEFEMKRDPDLGEPPQEAQVEVWGVESTVTGHHYDYMVYDDIINEQSVTTADQIEKVEEWWQMIQAIKELTAVEKMIGTRYHMHDIYSKIMDEKMFEEKNIAILPAIINNKPLYSFFTMKDLVRLKKRMGETAFSHQMMNEAVPKGKRIFVPPYPMWQDGQAPDVKNREFYITVDPAATTHAHSDETAISVAFVDRTNPTRLFFVECHGYKKEPDVIASMIVQKIEQYRPKRVGIELGLQQALRYLVDIKMSEAEARLRDYLPRHFVEIPTGKTAKADKFERTIAAMIREGRAYFRPEMTDLFKQMTMYNPFSDHNKDDIIDSTAMMMQTIPSFSPAHWRNIVEHNEKIPGQWSLTFDDMIKYQEKKKQRARRRRDWLFAS